MDSDEFLKKRFEELANRCYRENRYTYTGFLGIGELASFYETERTLPNIPYSLYGGTEAAERVILRFGNSEMLGYEEDYPVACMELKPLMAKFADDLTHRDVLGAIMSLGIEREVVGDIFLCEKNAYFLCLSTMVEYITDNLTSVKHTPVICKQTDALPRVAVGTPEELNVSVASERIDGVIAKTLNLSRNAVNELFRTQKIFLNGRLCENNSRMLKKDEVITVRGFGRITFREITGTSRKGKLYARVEVLGRR